MNIVLYIIAILFCSWSVFPAYAAEPSGFDAHFERASHQWGVPTALIKAIAQTESDLHPWTVNIGGKSYYPKTKKDALQLIQTAVQQGKMYDVGIMQINRYWLQHFNFRPADIIEPRFNILIGAWILAQEIQRYGLNWRGIGSYHTPARRNPARARAYAHKVLKRYIKEDFQ